MRRPRRSPERLACLFIVLVTLPASCTNNEQGATLSTAPSTISPSTISPSTTAPATEAPPVSPQAASPTSANPGTEPSTTPLPRSLTPLALDPAGFSSSIETLDEIVENRVIGSSWRDGCPVALDRLRYVEVTHFTNDGRQVIGELIVDAAVADEIVEIFATLFEAAFPIESMRLIDDFAADDLRSMQANNTSAFNCRFVAGTSGWSWHAYGRAIDINPLVNPYVTASGIQPPEGAAFADRMLPTPGMIHANDVVSTAFARHGWEWGGNWRSDQDYQHFARTDG